MSAIKPRIGYDSLGWRHRAVLASSEEGDGTADRAVDWRGGLRWTPKWSSNLLTNWDFVAWTSGASSDPDDWTSAGTGSSISRESSTVQIAPYSAALTRAGAAATLTQADPVTHTDWRGRTLEAGVWVHPDAANQVKVYIDDGVATTSSAYNTGTGAWEWVSVQRTVSASSTKVDVYVQLDVDGTAYLDGAILVEADHGQDPVDQTPDAPETARLYVYPGFDDGVNFVDNGYLRDWSDGPEAAPDRFSLVGSGASVALDSGATTGPVVGPYAVAVTRGGTDCYVEQTLEDRDLAMVLGEVLTLGAWVWASVASRASIEIAVTLRDGSTVLTHTGSQNDGDSDYDWEAVSTAAPIPHDATAVALRARVDDGDTTAVFDGFRLVVGASVDQTPLSKTADYFAVYDHNFGAAGLTVALEGTDDEGTGYTQVISKTPSNDASVWYDKDTAGWAGGVAQSYRFWRVVLSGGDRRGEVGVVAFGEYLELPEYLPIGVPDPHRRKLTAETPTAAGGFPLGRSVRFEALDLRIVQEWVEESFVTGDLSEFWDHAGDSGANEVGLPFFFQWDAGDHPAETFFCWVPDGTVLSAPISYAKRTQRLDLPVKAVAE